MEGGEPGNDGMHRAKAGVARREIEGQGEIAPGRDRVVRIQLDPLRTELDVTVANDDRGTSVALDLCKPDAEVATDGAVVPLLSVEIDRHVVRAQGVAP